MIFKLGMIYGFGDYMVDYVICVVCIWLIFVIVGYYECIVCLIFVDDIVDVLIVVVQGWIFELMVVVVGVEELLLGVVV